jgi:hypothetical protein
MTANRRRFGDDLSQKLDAFAGNIERLGRQAVIE